MERTISVLRVETRRDRRRFVAFPYALYKDSPYWVPPLRRDQARLLDPGVNPFFDHGRMQLFVALDEAKRVVGRIAGIVNEAHLAKFHDGVGFFGFFECVRDYGVAKSLFDAATSWVRSQGMTVIRGPTNPTINETSSFLVDGFDRMPSVMMPYNPPYYAEFAAKYGFERAMTFWAYFGDTRHLNVERLRRGVAIINRRRPSLQLRKLDPRRWADEVRMLHRLYNESFGDAWGQVPMTMAEVTHAADGMRSIIDPNLLFCVEDDGVPVGFSISLPNVNRLLRHLPTGRLMSWRLPGFLLRARYGEITEMRTVLVGVVPAYRRHGLVAWIALATIENAERHGYASSEMSWIMDDNVPLKNALDHLGAVIDKEYALFEMDSDRPGSS